MIPISTLTAIRIISIFPNHHSLSIDPSLMLDRMTPREDTPPDQNPYASAINNDDSESRDILTGTVDPGAVTVKSSVLSLHVSSLFLNVLHHFSIHNPCTTP